MNVKIYPLIRGLASYILPKSLFIRPGSGGSFSSEYCYSVWLRHVHYLIKNGLFNNPADIKRIAEIGPGDSLGIGLSAIYTGSIEYYAFDVIEHANPEKNLIISEELCNYFIENKEIPNSKRQKNTAPELDSYLFPVRYINYNLNYYQEKKTLIEKAITNLDSSIKISYIVPWMNAGKDDVKNLDLIFSQAVMEHVDDIAFAYMQMFRWLRPGGVISHQIDFMSHEMTEVWNGHWYLGDTIWRILSHGRKYPMNRLPLSAHIEMIEKAGFRIVFIKSITKENNFINLQPIVSGVKFSNDDLVTSGALIQAIKP